MIWSQRRNRALLFNIQDWDGRVKGNFKNSNFVLHMLLCPNKPLCYSKSTIMIVFGWGKNMIIHFIWIWPNKSSMCILPEKLHPNFAFLKVTLLFLVLLQLLTTLWMHVEEAWITSVNILCPWVFVLSGHCSPINNQKPKPWYILTQMGQESVQISRFKGLWNR